MKDFKLGDVLGLLARTAPFLIFRFLIYVGIAVGFVTVAGLGAGLGAMVGSIGGSGAAGGFYGGIIGLGVAGAALFMLREWLLYMVKAGHIAVLVELMEGKEIPGGRGQIDYARQMVRERFAESNVMFVLDRLIKGILRAFNRAFFTIAGIIPLPGLDSLVKFVGRVINLSLTYLDEVILSYNFRTRSENPWKSGQTALVLYAQNYKAFFKNAVWLVFVVWGLTFLVFLVVLAPAAAVVALIPGSAGFFTFVFALLFAWAVKQAVIDPFAMTALMQVFYRVTEGQAPNPEWEARLDGASKKFGELKEKAANWAPGAAPEPVPALSEATVSEARESPPLSSNQDEG